MIMLAEQIELITKGGTDWYTIIIPSAITVVGFIISFFISRRNYKDDITKIKKNVMIEKSEELIKDFTDVLTFSSEEVKEKDDSFFKNMVNRVYMYGSKEVIELFADYQQYNFSTPKELVEVERVFAYFCLIVSLIKYDLTDEIIKPNVILKMKISDYKDNDGMRKVDILVNDLIKRYSIDEAFLIEINS